MASTAVGSRRSRYGLRAVGLVYVGAIVLIPLYVITYRTVADGWSTFWAAISSDEAVTAFRLTGEVAVAAVVINTVFGVGVALLLSRYSFRGRRVLSALADLPISVSPIVVGLALVLVYGPATGWFGKHLSFQIIYALPGMVLATAFVSLPLMLRELVPVLEEAGDDMEQAARVLGASARQRFVRITLPTIRPALMYGLVLTFARSIGEFGAIRVVSGNIQGSGQTQTTTLLIEDKYQNFEPGTYQLAMVLVLATILAIVLTSFRRSKEDVS
ncbi:sulfate ABC transporter permease subunit [Jatrophihabitans sp.]|uniref:sulfate ABC transporter permease subunit n=1 Tax=Jatrophihabitans sp. TaxID=1932789 RepID=UPI0030C6852C|nr:sulfate transporter, inner rane subunit [Jatrophihabitans sp.]